MQGTRFEHSFTSKIECDSLNDNTFHTKISIFKSVLEERFTMILID